MFDIDWKGLILPFSYILVLGGTFVTFSTIYRKRKASTCARTDRPSPLFFSPLMPATATQTDTPRRSPER